MGSAAGALAGALTTPLDVLKTRVMLGNPTLGFGRAVREAAATVYRDHGSGGFLLGIQPRVAWLSLGGALFLGCYEAALRVVQRVL